MGVKKVRVTADRAGGPLSLNGPVILDSEILYAIRQDQSDKVSIVHAPKTSEAPLAKFTYKQVSKGVAAKEIARLLGLNGPIILAVRPGEETSVKVLGDFSKATGSTLLVSSEPLEKR